MENHLYTKVDKYIETLFAPEDNALILAKQSIENAHIPQHSIFPCQGKLLYMLAQMCKAKKILEIGTLGGYSTIWLARALPENGKLLTIEIDQKYADIAQKNIDTAGLSEKITIKVGEALSVLDQLEKEQVGTFDLIFLDAHKPSYAKYFQWALKHSHKGTLIIADNVIRNGDVINPESDDNKVKAVQEFNNILASNKDVLTTIIPSVTGNGYDGMALALIKKNKEKKD